VHFGTAVEVKSQECSPSFLTGVEEYRQGNYYKTVNIMDKLLQISPQDYRARYYMAISLVKLKRIDEAKKQYAEILTNAEDKDLIEFASKGLKYLDPKYYDQLKKKNFVVIEESTNTQKGNVDNTYVVKNQAVDNPEEANVLTLSPQQQQAVGQIADQNNVSQEELNNLIKILANNPSALKTINKLAGAKDNYNPNTPEGYDNESVAKLVKMLAFNNQMSMFDFDKKDNDNNNNDSSMDMMSSMLGGNNQNSQNNNNNMDQLMKYMSNPDNKGKINPETINMMFKQNMLNGFGGMNGF